MPTLTIEPGDVNTTGHCDCCGTESRMARGFVYSDDDAYAVYFVRWAKGHVAKNGALWNVIIGPWSEEATREQRFIAQLRYLAGEEGGFVVEDAEAGEMSNLATNLLKREDVIGRPIAKQIFDICDAVYLQDEHLGELKV